MSCTCELCQFANRIRSAKESRDFDAMYAVANDLGNALANMSMDLDCNEAILAGEWPGGRKILINAHAKHIAKGTEDIM